MAAYGLKGIRDLLADNGMAHLELEGIPYWWDDGAHRQESDRVRHALLEAAEALGARHIKVTPDGDDGPWDRGLWAARFAELAGQAEDVGARLGIEFFPGRTSRHCTTDCSSSRTPGTTPGASSSTPGTSPADTRPRPTSPRCRCTASSASS